MKFSFFSIILTFALQIINTAHASGSLHTGYWKENTPKGKAVSCSGRSTKEGMINLLNSVGWDYPEIPDIDWNTDEAVIIAPEKYYEDKEIVFYGLSREGANLILLYGWRDINHESGEYSNGAYILSQGSHAPSEASTIVVSYRKNLREFIEEKGGEFRCREQ